MTAPGGSQVTTLPRGRLSPEDARAVARILYAVRQRRVAREAAEQGRGGDDDV